MKSRIEKQSNRALTLIEVLTALAVLALVLFVALPIITNRGHHKHDGPIFCAGNLKQVGLAFRIYANDHNDLYPMQVAEHEGGALESIARGDASRIFLVMSNELSVPTTVICPSDTRVAATNWNALGKTNVSYFVGLDSVDTKPNMILSGDRDIAENGRLLSGTANLTTNRPVAWHRLLHKEGGNLLFADGSVRQVDTIQLREVLSQTGDTTNRVLFPQ